MTRPVLPLAAALLLALGSRAPAHEGHAPSSRPAAASTAPTSAAAAAAVSSAALAGHHHAEEAPLLEDMASPLLAAGSNFDLSRLTWDEATRQKPAGEVLKNVQVLKEVNAVRFMQAMGAMPIVLGESCESCHDLDDFASDAKAHKGTARTMLRMVNHVDRTYFDGRVKVTCWTCHRGHEEPEQQLPEAAFAANLKRFPAALEPPADKPEAKAGEVYKNLQILAGLPAGRVKTVMAAFSTALGVGCRGCHVKGDFASDDKEEKRTAREMFKMRNAITQEFFGGEGGPGCWTCHRGAEHPERMPPDVSAAGAAAAPAPAGPVRSGE